MTSEQRLGPRPLSRRRFLALCGGAVLGTGAYAFGVEPTWLKTSRVDVPIAGLPAAFDGYRIAQLSDLHVGSGVPLDFLRSGVEAASAFEPDLAVVTGDLIDGVGRGDPADAADLVASVRARDGTIAVLGNHDAGIGHPDSEPDVLCQQQVVAALAARDVTLLRNEACTVARRGERLRVAGAGDLWSGEFDASRLPLGGGTTIVLSHNPDTAPELAERGADLVLSGHTHGGQVVLPLVGPPYVPVRNKQFLAGLFRLGANHLHVNPGLGYTTLGIRFGARPEVTILTLRAA